MSGLPRPVGAEIARRPSHKTRFFIAIALTLAVRPAVAEPEPTTKPAYETVVEASRPPAETPREDQAADATVITSDRTPRSVESLADLLAESPGAVVTRLGGLGSIATVSLRGSTSEQVRIYVDGVPLNIAAGGAVDLSTVPLGDVERIEIYRGMTPVAFGESALGGVVAITTRTPRHTAATAEAGVGSFGTRLASVTAAWASTRGPRAYAGLHLIDSAGDFSYRSDNGTAFDPSDDRSIARANNDHRQADGLVRVVVPLRGRREVGAALLLFGREQGLPGFGLFPTTKARFSTARAMASLTYESRDDLGDGGRLRALAYAVAQRQQLGDPVPEIALVPMASDDRTWIAGASLTGGRPVTDWLRIGATLDGRSETFNPHDASSAAEGARGDRLFGAAAVESDVWVRRLALDVIPSLRLEAARDVTSGRDATYSTRPADPAIVHVLPLARVGLIQRPTSFLAVKANVGRYARLPSNAELYGNNGYLLGTPGLRPETGFNADLGASVKRDGATVRAQADVTGFAARVTDLIQFEPNGQHVARAANVSRARIAGVETALRVDAGRHLRLYAQGTFTNARDDSDVAARRGKVLPSRPRFRAYGRPELRALRLPRGATLGLYVDGDATDGNYLDAANYVRVPARLLVGGGAYADALEGRLRLVASARNLTDSRVSDLGGYPLPGRSLFVTLSWSTHKHSTEVYP